MATIVSGPPTNFKTNFFHLSERIRFILTNSRPLTATQVQLLEKQGNVIEGEIFVLFKDALEEQLLAKIKNNVFFGSVYLVIDDGVFGMYNSTFSDVIFDGASFVKNCSSIASVYVGSGCTVMDNGHIGGGYVNSSLFGLGDSTIIMCEETGSRKIYMHPKMTLENVTAAISSRAGKDEWNSQVLQEIKVMKGHMEGSSNLLSKFINSVIHAGNYLVRNVEISSVWIGPHSAHVSASKLSNVCVVDEEQSSKSSSDSFLSRISQSVVDNSIISYSVTVENFSVVENSVLCCLSKVSTHAKVVHSLIGSYSGVQSGECISSLIGPFVGFHHQSLVIATFWPAGKGNIGYGANIGSNHTGKSPDQELLAGEGVFFGLASIVKFPANFEKSPYSLIASGVVCLPQCVEMPFSLINSSSEGVSGLNEIFPAWILSDNMFTLIRNEGKFRQRQHGGQNAKYDWEVFRPDVMALVSTARSRLSAVPSTKTLYTELDISGLGKNFLRENSRLKAIDTYSFILRWYALRGVYRRVLWAQETGADMATALGEPAVLGTTHACWSYERSVLLKEGMTLSNLTSLLNEYSRLNFQVASSCIASKAKDDVRGAKIIGPSYSEFHEPAKENSVCVGAMKESRTVDETVGRMLSKL